MVGLPLTREISAAVVLATPNSLTLPVLLWDTLRAGETNQAYALSMLQLGINGSILLLARKLFKINLLGASK